MAPPLLSLLQPSSNTSLPIALRQILDRVHNLTRIALTPDFFDADGAEFVEDPEDEVETDEGL